MGHRDEITDADFLAVLPKAESEARYWARRAHLSPEDTEDLVQTALIEVIKGRERFDPLKSSWDTYAVNCAKWGAQRAITETAKKRKRRGITFQRMEGPEIDPRAAEPVISAEAEEIRGIILEILNTLKLLLFVLIMKYLRVLIILMEMTLLWRLKVYLL